MPEWVREEQWDVTELKRRLVRGYPCLREEHVEIPTEAAEFSTRPSGALL